MSQNTPQNIEQKYIGDALKQAREARKLSCREVAVQTNIREAYVIAMESENFAELPGAFFVRAYIKTYAEFLKLNAEELLTKLPDIGEVNQGGHQKNVQKLAPVSRHDARSASPKLIWLAVIALMSIAAYFAWPSAKDEPVEALEEQDPTETMMEVLESAEVDIALIAKEALVLRLQNADGSLFEEIVLPKGGTYFLPSEPSPLFVDDTLLDQLEIYVGAHRVEALNSLSRKDVGVELSAPSLKALIVEEGQ